MANLEDKAPDERDQQESSAAASTSAFTFLGAWLNAQDFSTLFVSMLMESQKAASEAIIQHTKRLLEPLDSGEATNYVSNDDTTLRRPIDFQDTDLLSREAKKGRTSTISRPYKHNITAFDQVEEAFRLLEVGEEDVEAARVALRSAAETIRGRQKDILIAHEFGWDTVDFLHKLPVADTKGENNDIRSAHHKALNLRRLQKAGKASQSNGAYAPKAGQGSRGGSGYSDQYRDSRRNNSPPPLKRPREQRGSNDVCRTCQQPGHWAGGRRRVSHIEGVGLSVSVSLCFRPE